MQSSQKRYNPSPFQSQSLSKQQKSYKSLSKRQGAFHRSPLKEKEDNERKIKKLMTSNPYNNVFNRLINLNDLKEFVKLSSQYVQFHQQEVKKFIPPVISERKRFSFSFQTSICSFITRDYRFLRHYLTLLENEFPEKKDKFRYELYEQFKDTVIDRKKFDTYFLPHQISKSCHKSLKNSEPLTPKSIKKPITIKTETIDFTQRSIMKQKSLKKRIQHRTPEKSKMKIIVPQKEISKQYSKHKTQPSKQIKQQRKFVKSSFENDSNKMSLQLKKSRRTTMQNIKIIEETLQQIQTIFSESNPMSKKNFSNIERKSQNISFSRIKPIIQDHETSKQSLNPQTDISNRSQEKKDKEEKNSEYNNCEPQKKQDAIQNMTENELVDKQNQEYQKLISRRSVNMSRRKKENKKDDKDIILGVSNKNSKCQSSHKKERKVVPFSQVFDVNDPHNRQLLQMVEHLQRQRQKQKENRMSKQKTTNELLSKIQLEVSIFRREVRRSFSQKEKQILSVEELEIVNLFPEIKQIGNWQHFSVDRDTFLYIDFGKYKGYKVEQILGWPKVDKDDEALKCLYLKKLQEAQQRQNVDNQQSLEQLKRQLFEREVQGVTLLLIER